MKKLCKSKVEGISAAAKRVINEWKAQIMVEDQLSKPKLQRCCSRTSESGTQPLEKTSPLQSDGLTTGNSVTDQASYNRQDVSSGEV